MEKAYYEKKAITKTINRARANLKDNAQHERKDTSRDDAISKIQKLWLKACSMEGTGMIECGTLQTEDGIPEQMTSEGRDGNLWPQDDTDYVKHIKQ